MTDTLPPRDADAADDRGADDDGDAVYAPEGSPARRPKTMRIVALVVGLVLVLFIGLLATRKPAGDGPVSDALLGKAVPRVQGTTLTGDRFDVDRLRGKWVVVNFFATWCTECVIEHPELVKFSEQHRATGDAEVVSIAFSDQTPRLEDFFAKHGGSWPVVVSDTGQAAIDFGVAKVPESFLVSPNGVVAGHFYGVTAKGLNDAITGLSAGMASGSTGGTTP